MTLSFLEIGLASASVDWTKTNSSPGLGSVTRSASLAVGKAEEAAIVRQRNLETRETIINNHRVRQKLRHHSAIFSENQLWLSIYNVSIGYGRNKRKSVQKMETCLQKESKRNPFHIAFALVQLVSYNSHVLQSIASLLT